ncbi:hypothetical protein V1520DRAFT_302274 [Lipomyces starkeyi]|uniref:Uncharacterized protein n=1 Tax=Lipomyces starkeyi NRRL Y-11557 TaxID=675824 RepID=A0A1E3Q2Q5_LIPST|nr:hypothetical protein LIPSTDRAFT_313881 [Lipomyces starkeyi NRRL Y-11557]
MSPKPSPQILRLVIMSLYCISIHSAKVPASRDWLFADPPAKCLRQSPNLRRIGRGSRCPF